MSSRPVNTPLAVLGYPTQIGCFSVANEIVLPNSIASLRYFKHPPQNASLSEGLSAYLEQYKHDTETLHRRPLDNIFTVLNPNNVDAFRSADVVTWRGIVYKFVSTISLEPYVSLMFIQADAW
jgi:hypothetical protein